MVAKAARVSAVIIFVVPAVEPGLTRVERGGAADAVRSDWRSKKSLIRIIRQQSLL